jgi:hypothetical protein
LKFLWLDAIIINRITYSSFTRVFHLGMNHNINFEKVIWYFGFLSISKDGTLERVMEWVVSILSSSSPNHTVPFTTVDFRLHTKNRTSGHRAWIMLNHSFVLYIFCFIQLYLFEVINRILISLKYICYLWSFTLFKGLSITYMESLKY